MFCCKKSKHPSYRPSGTQVHRSWETQNWRPSGTSLLVAAIDFGTTYSGWAFSFKHEYEKDPEKISAKMWYGGQLVTGKAPTAVLIKPDGKTLDSFGYEAESKYAELTSQENCEHETWYYFRRFKMMLHDKMGLKRDLELEDETQKKALSAKTVFSLTIRYLKEDMLKTSRDRLGGDEIREDEITWVLTVPAIWNDAAKQFMREAAVEAGIKNENLKIALEPEAASIFCRLLPVERLEGAGVSSFIAGSRYMVLDAGGGTVDITIHEVMPGGQLKELHNASGGAWGGTEVDEAYKQFFISLVGNPVFQSFCMKHKDDHIHMFRDFEIKKRDVTPDKDSDVIIRLPLSLKEMFQETGEDFCNAIKQTRYAEEVSLVGDKLRIHASVMRGFFARSVENTISHMKELMKNDLVQTISGILMVGGYSESKMLQCAIKDNFPNVKVIVPAEASLVVLKGAVVFGHTPSAIVQRVCRYTYGFNTSVPFDPRIHDRSKLIFTDDGPKCTDIFQKHVEIGQAIMLDQPQIQGGSYWPTFNYQTDIPFEIYCSSKKSPLYVTDEGCTKLGQITVLVLDMSVPIYQREFVVSMSFSGTEIEVSAKEKRTGRCTKTTVNFLG